MTDEEMIKIMEICKDNEIPCDDCPLVEYVDCEEISRNYCYERFKELQSENAFLRARLDKAVELKFKIGDTIYLIQRTDKNPKGEVLETKFIDYEARNNSLIYIAIHGSTYFQFNEDYIGKLVFTDKSEAESRLAELKGEK